MCGQWGDVPMIADPCTCTTEEPSTTEERKHHAR